MRRGGFTLPEVLATLVLIGLVLPAVMQGVSLALRLAEDASMRVQAASLAETKLTELALSESGDGLGAGGGFGPDHPAFRWTSTEQVVEDSMAEVTVQVQWQSRGQPRSLTMTTLRGPILLTSSEAAEVLQ